MIPGRDRRIRGLRTERSPSLPARSEPWTAAPVSSPHPLPAAAEKEAGPGGPAGAHRCSGVGSARPDPRRPGTDPNSLPDQTCESYSGHALSAGNRDKTPFSAVPRAALTRRLQPETIPRPPRRVRRLPLLDNQPSSGHTPSSRGSKPARDPRPRPSWSR